jgi:hypothetical protein
MSEPVTLAELEPEPEPEPVKEEPPKVEPTDFLVFLNAPRMLNVLK